MIYRLVEVNSAHASNVCYEMECHINLLMKSGWEPIGGVGVLAYSDCEGKSQSVVYQSLVKKGRMPIENDTVSIDRVGQLCEPRR